MESFTFIPKNGTDARAIFANQVCQLLYDTNSGDMPNIIIEIKPFYDHFREFVRNVYELIDSEIPLFALYELKTLGADNWDFSNEEYDGAISRAIKACTDYYGTEN